MTLNRNMKEGGTYALVIPLGAELHLPVGKMGISILPAGYYVYAGSALGGLSGRLRHHLRSEKKLHWHIDYLLQQAPVEEIWYSPGPDKIECRWNAILQALPCAIPAISGFGSSDCSCSSHLTRFVARPLFCLFSEYLKNNRLPEAHRLVELGF